MGGLFRPRLPNSLFILDFFLWHPLNSNNDAIVAFVQKPWRLASRTFAFLERRSSAPPGFHLEHIRKQYNRVCTYLGSIKSISYCHLFGSCNFYLLEISNSKLHVCLPKYLGRKKSLKKVVSACLLLPLEGG